jgi:hypothetical protein
MCIFIFINRITRFGSKIYTNGLVADAVAYLNKLEEESAVDATTWTQVDLLVKRLKGIKTVGETKTAWQKANLLALICGSTAYKHKFNLKDPRDADDAFRMVEVGTLAHASNQITANTTSFYNTKLIPSAVLPAATRGTMFLYTKSSGSNSFPLMGCQGSTIDVQMSINPRTSGGSFLGVCYRGTGAPSSAGIGTGVGLSMVNRSGNRMVRIYRDLVMKANSNNANTGARPSTEAYLGAFNENLTTRFAGGDRIITLAGIMEGLTDEEADDVNTALQYFHTKMGK